MSSNGKDEFWRLLAHEELAKTVEKVESDDQKLLLAHVDALIAGFFEGYFELDEKGADCMVDGEEKMKIVVIVDAFDSRIRLSL